MQMDENRQSECCVLLCVELFLDSVRSLAGFFLFPFAKTGKCTPRFEVPSFPRLPMLAIY